MLAPRSFRASASKQLMECLTFCNMSPAINARAYSSKADIVYFLKQFVMDQRRVAAERRVINEEKVKKTRNLRKTNFSLLWNDYSAPDKYSLHMLNIGNWWKQKEMLYKKHDQRFQVKRHEILGYDLAAAHFLLARQSRVKFRDLPDWLESKNNTIDLPKSYDPEYIVTGIDIHKMDLVADGLENFIGLVHLEWLSLKGSDAIDDWALDKISAEYPALKYLDISDCKNVTERGLESLYRMYSLEKLIVTNHYKSVAFELTCLMLEEVLPDLECEILLPNQAAEVENM